MKEVSAKSIAKPGKRKPMVRQPAKSNAATSADHDSALQRCYGKIGISAVAAAAQYQGAAKNPAYVPAAIAPHDEPGRNGLTGTRLTKRER